MVLHYLTIGLLGGSLFSPPTSHNIGTTSLAPNRVTVTATDYSFAMPDSLPAGPTKFQLVNHGRELHHLFLVRLTNGKTAADLTAAMKKPGPFPPWAIEEGGPNATDPATTSLAATVNLEPGHYAALCIVPGPDGIPHVMKGMIRDLVVGRANSAMQNKPTMTISLVDYGFEPRQALTVGHHVVLVRNDGKQTHELEIARLLPGKTPADLGKWAEKMAGPPPAHFIGGVSPIAPGKSNQLALNLSPGHYVFLCFVPDAKDGKPHVAHGMVRDFVVR